MDSHLNLNKNYLDKCNDGKNLFDSDDTLEDIGFSDWSDGDSTEGSSNHNLEELMGLSEIKEEKTGSDTSASDYSEDGVLPGEEITDTFDKNS
jgi:hypothetical protein